MARLNLSPSLLPLLVLLGVLFCARPAAAFGAGNIASTSKIEGINWRHGDIEDTLKQLMMATSASGTVFGVSRAKLFDSNAVKRVYFGNWLRDYSQAVDVGSLKYVEAGTIRLILWILAFMSFGYATGEFEVTAERLGCYRPEEHIDNPKDYADNLDARKYDPRLRGPVDPIELEIDLSTGMKNYIANERIGRLRSGDRMHTSAGLVRRLFTQCIETARSYAQTKDKAEKYEAWRLLGTGLHCLEDFSAHSNYVELCLIELGERSVFPHVGRRTQVEVRGRTIWPIITGTFGGVDFLHSVLGEASDKIIQSEIQELESTINDASKKSAADGGEKSILRGLLDQLPLGNSGELNAQADELESKSKRKEEASRAAWGVTAQGKEIANDIYPFLEFHDKIMKAINDIVNKIPGLQAIVEAVSEAVSIFIFSLLAPYILPVLNQVKAELATGSSGVIESSAKQQYIVFNDDYSSDPTHSMLSKDHFTNRLNEPAGKVASEVIRWVVPQLMAAWDDESIDSQEVIENIISGVFHHPAFRNGGDNRRGIDGRQKMFSIVQQWWEERDEMERDYLRSALSREGVREGRNHKEGQDSGHGCGAPIHRTKPRDDGGEFSPSTGNFAGNIENEVVSAITGGGSNVGGILGGAIGVLGGVFAGGSTSQYGRANEGREGVQSPYSPSYGKPATPTFDSYRQENRVPTNYGQPASPTVHSPRQGQPVPTNYGQPASPTVHSPRQGQHVPRNYGEPYSPRESYPARETHSPRENLAYESRVAASGGRGYHGDRRERWSGDDEREHRFVEQRVGDRREEFVERERFGGGEREGFGGGRREGFGVGGREGFGGGRREEFVERESERFGGDGRGAYVERERYDGGGGRGAYGERERFEGSGGRAAYVERERFEGSGGRAAYVERERFEGGGRGAYGERERFEGGGRGAYGERQYITRRDSEDVAEFSDEEGDDWHMARHRRGESDSDDEGGREYGGY
ncbi:hypothetical protein RUND412_007602 [Rhizina undulata]